MERHSAARAWTGRVVAVYLRLRRPLSGGDGDTVSSIREVFARLGKAAGGQMGMVGKGVRHLCAQHPAGRSGKGAGPLFQPCRKPMISEVVPVCWNGSLVGRNGAAIGSLAKVPIRKGVRHLCRNGPQGATHKGA